MYRVELIQFITKRNGDTKKSLVNKQPKFRMKNNKSPKVLVLLEKNSVSALLLLCFIRIDNRTYNKHRTIILHTC